MLSLLFDIADCLGQECPWIEILNECYINRWIEEVHGIPCLLTSFWLPVQTLCFLQYYWRAATICNWSVF